MKGHFDLVVSKLKHELGFDTDQELAEALGMKRAAFANRRRGNSLPYQEIIKLCTQEMLNINYIFDDVAEVGELGHSYDKKPTAQHLVSESASAYKPVNKADLVEIQEYNNGFSAGVGAYAEDHALAIGSRPFSLSWLKKKGLNPQDLVLDRVRGDSNEPALKDKDMVLIDISRDKPTPNMPVAFRLDGELYIKFYQSLGDGKMCFISVNKAYNDMIIDASNPPADFEIIGWVVWHAHSWI